MARFIRLGFLLGALLGTATLWAAITGSISGVVADPSGAVIPGLTVVAISLSTNVVTTAVSDGLVNNTGQGGFGYVTGANDPRIMQVALKFLF